MTMLASRYVEAGVLITFLLLIGFCTRIDPALAQAEDDSQAGTVIDEVVVRAPMDREIVTRRAVGSPEKIIELRRSVSFADLDLSKPEGVLELERRIEMLARDSCEMLEEMFPLERLDDAASIRRCTKEAISGTEDELRNVVAAAN
jgi:UrcA family protein